MVRTPLSFDFFFYLSFQSLLPVTINLFIFWMKSVMTRGKKLYGFFFSLWEALGPPKPFLIFFKLREFPEKKSTLTDAPEAPQGQRSRLKGQSQL